jgi:alpha-D-ribose 1-methylphosphonate 5-phosphate C-P lyase
MKPSTSSLGSTNEAMTAKQIIAKHYGIPESSIDDEQVIHELVNLRRKHKKGNMDDMQERMYHELDSHGMISVSKDVIVHPITGKEV